MLIATTRWIHFASYAHGSNRTQNMDLPGTSVDIAKNVTPPYT